MNKYDERRVKALLGSAVGMNDLSTSILEMLLQPAVQNAIAGMTKGDLILGIKDGVCVTVTPLVEFRRGYDVLAK